MKKGIRGHDVRAEGLSNIAKRCKEVGIEYIQLVLERSIKDFKTGMFSEEYAASLKEQIGDRKTAVLGSYINPSNPDKEGLFQDMEKFKEKIRYATVINPIVVGTETGIYKPNMTDTEEAYQYLLKNIKELAEYASQYNVNIGIEGVHCFVINTPEKMARLVNDLNCDNVKVIFDPVNYINSENYMKQDDIINKTFELMADKLAVIHAKDFTVKDGKLAGAIPGEGELNYSLIFKLMKEYNLDIPVICEEIDEVKAAAAFNTLEKIL